MSREGLHEQDTLSGAHAAPAADPLVGTKLAGTYLVLRRIAEGGMGLVYEGEHARLKRRVAIKVMLSHYAKNSEVLARFRREAEVIGQLGHPHIVQVVDVDETPDGSPFLVMEYLEGETLAQRLEHVNRLSVPDALRIISQVASALTCTHERDIVHRDLKPENVFLVRATGEKDFVKVLDFGISKVKGPGPKLTMQHMVIGTPAYMAPEQARGGGDVDHRVDQYALAAMAYEMLAGRQPYPSDDPATVIQMLLTEEPARLETVAPWVPVAVASVVHRGMAKRAADRYPSIGELVAAFEVAAVEAGEAVTVPPAARVVVDGPAVRIEHPTPLAPGRPPSSPLAADGSKHGLIREARTPPPADPAFRVERVAPLRDRASSTPASVRREPSSEPPARSSSSQPPRSSPRASSNPEPAGSAGPMSHRFEHHPISSPPARFATVPPDAASRAKMLSQAEEHLGQAREAFKQRRLDDAVLHAERLIEIAVYGKDPRIYDLLRVSLTALDHIFEARVGDQDRELRVTAEGADPTKLNLSPKAAELLSKIGGGAKVREVLADCGVPRRDAVRMLAGLMRRGAVAAVGQ